MHHCTIWDHTEYFIPCTNNNLFDDIAGYADYAVRAQREYSFWTEMWDWIR